MDKTSFMSALKAQKAASRERCRHVNTITGYDQLPLTERAHRVVVEAQVALTPAWVEAMRTMPAWRKLEMSNSMFVEVRSVLIQQGLRAGLSLDEAREKAAIQMLGESDV